MKTIEARVRELEASLRRWRRVALAILVVATGATLMASGDHPRPPGVLQAEKFEVVDGEGNVIGLLGRTSLHLPAQGIDTPQCSLLLGSDLASGVIKIHSDIKDYTTVISPRSFIIEKLPSSFPPLWQIHLSAENPGGILELQTKKGRVFFRKAAE